MVWFQCEDCGENLKKPKLPNHFRICSAYKLSCIDCGQVFDRQTVQAHTTCITEAEKYGPKGQVKAANGTPAKGTKAKPDVDINVGLSDRPPWFCSLCNTNATSKQALLLHADGKKHRAKARARAAALQPKPSVESDPSNKDVVEETPNEKSVNDEKTDKGNDHSNGILKHDAAENGNVSAKKRKIDSSNDDGSTENFANELGKGNASKVETDETSKKKKKKVKGEADVKNDEKKVKCEAENDGEVETVAKKGSGKKIKWKKLITTTLKSAPDGVLKMKKLQKEVLKSLRDSGTACDDSELSATLELEVNSSSKFTVDGKYIRLAV